MRHDLASAKAPSTRKKSSRSAFRTNPRSSYIFAGLALWALVYLGTVQFLELSLLYAVAASLNIATFILAAFDKAISPTKLVRVPESIFWGAAALGGSVGLLLAMELCRHKTSKAKFQLILAIVALAQVALFSHFFGHEA